MKVNLLKKLSKRNVAKSAEKKSKRAARLTRANARDERLIEQSVKASMNLGERVIHGVKHI